MKIERFEDLEIWKESREMCRVIFSITSCHPFVIDFRFRDQIRASSGSVMDKIAEGFCRDGNKEFVQFLSIAKGSCGETQSQLYRALDCGYITPEQLKELESKANAIMGKITRLMQYLRISIPKGAKYPKQL